MIFSVGPSLIMLNLWSNRIFKAPIYFSCSLLSVEPLTQGTGFSGTSRLSSCPQPCLPAFADQWASADNPPTPFSWPTIFSNDLLLEDNFPLSWYSSAHRHPSSRFHRPISHSAKQYFDTHARPLCHGIRKAENGRRSCTVAQWDVVDGWWK